MRIAVPPTAATSPKTSAQANIEPVGCWNGGSPGMASEKVPNPLNESSPTKMRVPTPAASNPGTRTRPSIGPPRPVASSRMNAPRMGEPNRVLMAAKLPAAAMTVAAVGGASRRARRTAITPRIPPMRMSGASGPRTAPRLKVAREATTTPGRSTISGVPPVWNPSAGEWPPVPGRYRMAEATTNPATANGTSGHHTGGPWNPIHSGIEPNSQPCRRVTSSRYP